MRGGEGVLGKEECQRALPSSSSNDRAALSQHLMGNEGTTTERTGAGFSFCCLWKAAPFLTDLSTDFKKQFQFQGAPDGNLALRGSETGV